MDTVLIIGCGDIGQRIARQLRATDRGRELVITGLVQSKNTADKLDNCGCKPTIANLDDKQTLASLATAAATIFYLAPPPAEGDTDPYLRNFLAMIGQEVLPEKIVLLSTTAVYGDCQGNWITEDDPARPETARGRRRLDAETTLRQWCEQNAVPYVILRVGGIYGPGRWPLERLKKGLPILFEAESPYTNRIHQDDLAQICIAAAERGIGGEIYNVADGEPGTMSGYFKAIASAFGIPQPPEITLEEARKVMSAGMLSYLKESRRINNRKLVEDLQIDLQYPNLEAGLARKE